MEIDDAGGDPGGGADGAAEAPSATGAQLPPHLADRHDYLTSGPDMNFNVCIEAQCLMCCLST